MADDLAHAVRRRIGDDEKCMCGDHIALRVYDAAKQQAL